MKRLLCFLLFAFFTSSIFAICTEDVINQLFTKLASRVPWLDITPIDYLGNTCRFTIRYFPCETPIDSLLKEAVATLKPYYLFFSGILAYLNSNCTLKSAGIHTQIEGYCALQNVLLFCYT